MISEKEKAHEIANDLKDDLDAERRFAEARLLACCPFCGKSDKDTSDHQPAVSLTHYPASNAYVVQCVWCGANGPVAGQSDEAIDEWNKAQRQQANADLRQDADNAASNVK